MRNFVSKFFYDFKEYIALIVLSIFSLYLLTGNEKPQIKKIKTFALGNFAFLNSAVSSLKDFFIDDSEIERLKKENARLILEVNLLRKYGLENEELRNMLSFRDTSSFKLLPASVISKMVSKVQGIYILNKGYSDGVRFGMPAITDKGLVGIVSDVSENFCSIRTIENSNLSIAVTIQKNNVEGIMSWDGRQLVIKDIPTTYDVEEGDRIETSDFSTLFPPAIPVGIIGKKQSNVLGLLHNLTVKPFVDIKSIKNLFIVKIQPSKQIIELQEKFHKRK